MAEPSRTYAVLGPTNTGKTHYAIERMLGYPTGVIGLPLRLLAREVYEKIVALRGPSVVALVTGEERIVPPRTKYWVCTVEAMPQGLGADFVAVDEIQLCADPERGHVFTDRLLHMRGQKETQFLGAATMRGVIAELVPGVSFLTRERLSQLAYTGPKKLAKMPGRSAIVGFSVDNVYAIAELLRRQKGGAAVVMGALSPRTRNAQVELYQNGDVDYLVATDAIGMGLNLDVDHVAFSSLTKFDGRRMRMLAPNELAQIAGRAGRGMRHGTFGVTGEAPEISDEVVEAITNHRFAPISRLEWRNSDLRFGTVDALLAALEQKPATPRLGRSRDTDDLQSLRSLSQIPAIRDRLGDATRVKLLWDVCRIPDFRGISPAEHVSLLETIFTDLTSLGRIPDDWLARQVKRLDRSDGDIDTLSKRLAFIRTWTYVAQRNGWVDDETHWRDVTRAVEDRLSDALHGALTQRFVDRRTSVLLRRLKQKEAVVAEVNDSGEVTVEGEFAGRLEGFRFIRDKAASGPEAKALDQASLQALAPHFHLKADRFYNAPDTEIDFTEQGGLMWGSDAVGKLVKGADPLKPTVKAFVDDEAGDDVAQKVQRRLQHFIDRKIATLFEPLLALQNDETLTGMARGFGFQMVEALGVLPRGDVAEDVKSLDQEARGMLRKHGIRFGQFTIFMPLLLKPAPTRLRLVLWSLQQDLDEFPESPPPGLVTVPARSVPVPQGYFTMAGYRAAGERAIRIDMLERLADMLRGADSRGGFEATPDMLSITGMTLEQFADLMQGLGYRAERGERDKARAAADAAQSAAEAPEAPEATAEAKDAPEGATEATEATDAPEATAEPVEAIPADASPVTPVEGEVEAIKDTQEAAGDAAATDDGAAKEPEIEVFYTFTWAGRGNRQNARQGQRQGQGQGQGQRQGQGQGQRQSGQQARGKDGEARGKGRGPRKSGGKPENKGPRKFSAKPEKSGKIDPDNPFAAALMGLRDKS
jgi:ATP-dependent RNA helicase SUPV3L1/SUV3